MSVDLTELFRLTEKLNAADRALETHCRIIRTMCDLLPIMCWCKDLDEKYLFANKMVCDILLHTDPDEIIGQTDMDVAWRERIGHENDVCPYHSFGETCSMSDQMVFSSGKPYRRIEEGYTRGKKLTIDVRKYPLLDENDKLIGIVGAANIVTAGKRRFEDYHPKKTIKISDWKREPCM